MGDAGDAADGAIDGRVQRRVRSEDAVVAALLDLLDEGEVQPTSHQVSARSGVSMRSIFRLFEDMDALHRVAIARQHERITPLLTPLPTEGPLADRIDALVQNRRQIFDFISPVRRLAVRLAPTSEPIRTELARFGRFLRAQVADVLGVDGPLLEALDLATSWDAWERLRVGQGLDDVAAAAVVRRTVEALMGE